MAAKPECEKEGSPMIFNFFYGIFRGCRHYHLSRVFTLQEETYKVCLDCGTHIPYSPLTLLPLSAREVRRLKAAQAGELEIMPASNNSAPLITPQGRKSSAA
jgi:hypothetical protein